MKYVAVIENEQDAWGAWLPDLPGLIVTGKTEDEVLERLPSAVAFHIEGIREEGHAVPTPQARIVEIEVAA